MNRFSRSVSVFVCLLVIAGSILGVAKRQAIFDYFALKGYQPSDRIVSLANDTTMNDSMRRVFYINHPELNSKTDFKDKCPATEQSIVLGCYVERKGIFLLDVDDKRLEGVIQVTAAHEALHAEYDRLSKEDKQNVDRMTASYFATIKDERIKKTIEQYRSKDASVVPNELHSILGTEVRNLPPELETYYSRYFNNRSQIVQYSENYEQTFVDLEDQVDRYDKQLKSLNTEIESNKVEIEGQNNEIEQQKNRLDSLLNSGKTQEYNEAVPEYNARVNSVNSLIASTKRQINDYNAIVQKRNAIVTTEQQLVESINSNIIPNQEQ